MVEIKKIRGKNLKNLAESEDYLLSVGHYKNRSRSVSLLRVHSFPTNFDIGEVVNLPPKSIFFSGLNKVPAHAPG